MTTTPYMAELSHLNTLNNGKYPNFISGAPGKRLMSEKLWRQVTSQADFTERECAVCRLLFEGLTRDKIAEQMNLKQRTVRHHLENIHTKLDVHNRVDVVLRIVELRDRMLSKLLDGAESSDVDGQTKE